MNNTTLLAACALGLLAVACNDNSEDISIRPDGSATVKLAVEGNASDVADGYPLPLRAPWIADDAPTLEWLRSVGPDTGGANVRLNVEKLDKTSKIFKSGDTVHLAVHADFRSVADLPATYAPEAEPYRSAFLQRASELRIEKKGARTVYTFERRYAARDWKRFDLVSLLRKHVSDELWKRVEAAEKLSNDDRAHLTRALESAAWESMISFANAGLEASFVHGDASLSVAAVDRIRARVHDAIVRCAPLERFERMIVRIFPPDGSKSTDTGEADGAFEREMREVLRNALSAALQAENAPVAMQNAVMGELEWHLAAYDASSDLSDETFTLNVEMPGMVVGGNADELRGSTATWKFNGKDLHEREIVLRAVSVLE